MLLNRAAQLQAAGQLGPMAHACLVKHLQRLGASRDDLVQAALLATATGKGQVQGDSQQMAHGGPGAGASVSAEVGSL